MSDRAFPLWFNILYTLAVLAIIVVYSIYYGPENFLWFSDVALILLVFVFWFESSLLASMIFIGIIIPELAWNLDFFLRLALGREAFGITEYMFEPERPAFLRAISLFHVPLPVFMVWTVYKLGYDRRALWAQTLLGWVILLVCWLFTEPRRNINWVFGLGEANQTFVDPTLYFVIVMIVYAVALWLPSHFAARAIFPAREKLNPEAATRRRRSRSAFP